MKIKQTFLVFVMLCSITLTKASDLPTIKAMYIYNFLRYIEWPATSFNEKFTIGVYGDEELIKALLSFTQNRKAGNRAIEVLSISSPAHASKCHIVFVAKEKAVEVTKLRNIVSDFCLIVSDEIKIPKANADIELLHVDNQLRFRINTGVISNRNLSISKKLFELASL